MSNARATFFEAIAVMKELVIQPLLTDTLPHSSPHNIGARTLRNGLTVSAFTAMESYLEDALEERMSELTRSSLRYGVFNDQLRKFLTIEAIQGLVTRAGFQDEADRLQFTELHIPRLARFQLARPIYTALGFSPKGSNIGEQDLLKLLKAFSVNGGWNTLSAICSALGVSSVSLSDSFRNFAKARNKSAHDSSNNVTSSDLITYLETALLIGISVDIVSSHAIRAHTRASTVQQAVTDANNITHDFRFIDQNTSGSWTESFAGRVTAVHPNLSTAKTAAKRRRARALTVVRDTRLFPVELL